MKVITSRLWKKCDAPYCILLTNQKAIGHFYDWYLCHEHCSEERLEELDEWARAV